VHPGFAKHSPVPVINMETITHPCQELALPWRCRSTSGLDLRGKKYVLTWTYHPKPLNTAVANSALIIATKLGMDVTLLCPTPEYRPRRALHGGPSRTWPSNGGSFTVSHDIASAYRGADVVYAKSWGALPYFGNWDRGEAHPRAHRTSSSTKRRWRSPQRLFSHCLPVRRNVKVTDEVMDSPALRSPSTRPRTACTCRRRDGRPPRQAS
jgi:N-acetylornithine carbamoyltransferase